MNTVNDSLKPMGLIRVVTFSGNLPQMDATDLARLLDGQYADLWSRCLSDQTFPNLVVNSGRIRLAQLIMGESTTVFGYMGLSTGTVSPAAADTALVSEIIRKTCSIAASYSNYYLRFAASFATNDFNSTGISGEAIYDTASTGGTMLCEASITLSKNASQSAVVEHRVLLSTG